MINFKKTVLYNNMETPIFDFTKINKVETKLLEIKKELTELQSKIDILEGKNEFGSELDEESFSEEEIRNFEKLSELKYYYKSFLISNKKLIDENFVSKDELDEYEKYQLYTKDEYEKLENKVIDNLINNFISSCPHPPYLNKEQEIESGLIKYLINNLKYKKHGNKIVRKNVK